MGLADFWLHSDAFSLFLALVLLAIFAVLSGAGLAFAALSQTPVNVFWALGSLLGLNLILLLSWTLGLIFAGEHGATLGRLWLWLSEKLARDAKAAQLAPALLLMLQRQKLNRWALGTLVNGLWLLAMVSALVLLLTLMATRRYGFVWETTILSADTFINMTQALGALPALLGFNVPTVDMIRASGDTALNIESARQAWATWLVGVLVVYGVLPRLLLALFCFWRWNSGKAALRLDLNLPGTDGREVLAELKATPTLRRVPVVVLSTSSNPRDVAACYQSGVNSYMLKPVNFEKYTEQLGRLFEFWLGVAVLPEAPVEA